MSSNTHDVILFYRYVSIDDADDVVERVREFFDKDAKDKDTLGRVLVSNEGVNGTVCAPIGGIDAFIDVLSECVPGCREMPLKRSVSSFQVFHDARVEKVRELVGWGIFDDVKYAKSEKVVHLKPKEFHEALKTRGASATVLDLRNENESLVGKFRHATTPNARNMQELGRFLDDEAGKCANKEVFMYCTGGIRCEKAALYLEKKQPEVSTVYQLEGGIHEYLEEFGDDEECLFLGKNFTFDRRGVSASGKDDDEAWRCQRCRQAEPTLRSCAVCCVCRYPLVLCEQCQTSSSNRGEWTCSHHATLDGVYSFYAIPDLDDDDLARRVAMMKDMESKLFAEAPKKTTNRRRTLRKCYAKMEAELERRRAGGVVKVQTVAYCRNSGRALSDCGRDCTGFWGPGHLIEKTVG